MRQPYTAHNGFGANPASSGYGYPNPESDRLNNIKRAVDAIESRIASSQTPPANQTYYPPQPAMQMAPPMAPLAMPSHYPNQQPVMNGQMGSHFGGAMPFAPQPGPQFAPYHAPQPPVNNELGMMQEQLTRLSNQIAQTTHAFQPAPQVAQPAPQAAPLPPQAPVQSAATTTATQDLQTIAAELQKRQQELNKAAQQSVAAVTKPAAVADNKLDAITTVLGGLKKELSDLKKQVSKPVPVPAQKQVSQAEIDRIAAAVANLQTAPAFDEQMFQRLSTELEALRSVPGLDELRSGLGDDLRLAMRREISTSNGNQASDITRRIDERIETLTESLASLSQNFDRATVEAANTVTPRVDNLANQMDALRVTVDDLPQTLALTRMEDQLGDIVAKMEALSQTNSELSAQSTRLTESLEEKSAGISANDLSSIEGRLDEVARALVAVSNSAAKSEPAPTIDLSGIERVEARISELSRAVDTIGSRDSTEQLQGIAVRIDGLTERLGSFEKYAESGDLGGATAMFAAPDVGMIEEQLRQLNARVEESSVGSQTGQLEQQLAQLSSRIEEAANTNSTAAQMSNLEAQIGQIIRHMNKTVVPEAVDFSPVEARLGQIEHQLMSNQNFSLEAAQQAAQQAVALMGANAAAGGGDNGAGEIINALSQDLRALQEAAENGNVQNTQTVQNLEGTLQQVVERLSSIEGSIAQAAQTVQTAQAAPAQAPLQNFDHSSFVAHPPQEPAQAQAQPQMAGADAQPMHVAAPALDPTDHIENAGYAAQMPQMGAPYHPVPEDDAPLEPGSAAPDLNAMVQQASEQLNEAHNAAVAGDGLPQQVDPSLDDARPGDDMQPDAVTAARRALQATTAEMNAVKEEAKSSSKASGIGGKLGNALPNFDMTRMRKPLVMGAAALLLAVIAFKGVGMFMDDGKKVAAKKKPKKAKVEMSSAAPKAKDAKGKAKGVKIVDAAKEAPAKVADLAKPLPKDGAKPLDAETVVVAPVRQIGKPEKVEMAGEKMVKPKPVETAAAQQPAGDEIKGAEAQKPAEEKTIPVSVAKPAESGAGIEVPSSAGSRALVQAASSGDTKALFHIGMRYSEGNGVKRNMTEAAKWLRLSAEKGFAPAQYSIGSLYEKGIGVERDVTKASEWYNLAAAQGNARAMHNLAVIHAMGNPPAVQPNMDKAVGWFKKAAAYGIKDSQFNLGILYGQGMGVPQNLGDSYKWFALAAKTGDSDASSKRDEVANAMDPDDLDNARKDVNDWIPQKITEAANRVAVPKEWQGRGTPERKASSSGAAPTVKKAQAMLNQRGFNVGNPDGLMGPKTKRAIMEFQRSAGIPVTGKVDDKLIKALSI